jgi:hypothetical protein
MVISLIVSQTFPPHVLIHLRVTLRHHT